MNTKKNCNTKEDDKKNTKNVKRKYAPHTYETDDQNCRALNSCAWCAHTPSIIVAQLKI